MKIDKEDRKCKEKINHPRYINNLNREMTQSGKLLNEYETKITETLET